VLMRALFVISLLLGLTSSSWGQTRPADLKSSGAQTKALAFFEQIEARSFDDYLKRVRLPKVSEAFKAQVLANITKGEEFRVSSRMQKAFAWLAPILNYHDRDSAIEIRVIGARELFIGLQGRAVLLISEKALTLLPVEELQAVVAHELGHEYFWGELMEARQQKRLEVIREIELRCDGIAVITLHRLGLDPSKLISALTRITMFNARLVSTDPLYHPAPNERSQFIRAMSALIKTRKAMASARQQSFQR
jgi:Zn-dependent protease with chaperone function